MHIHLCSASCVDYATCLECVLKSINFTIKSHEPARQGVTLVLHFNQHDHKKVLKSHKFKLFKLAETLEKKM